MHNNTKAILLLMGIFSISPICFAANGDALIQLDNDRADQLQHITNELSYGHLSLDDAKRLKGELDTIIPLETKYKEGHQVKLKTISDRLDKIRQDIKAAIQPNKVWMGIDCRNMALRQKIDAALDANKLTKEEAENLGLEEKTLRNHENESDTTDGLTYDDAIATAAEILRLDKKIDELSNK